VLLLSIAKWCNLLISQLLVYDGDRQAPQDLLNLLPEGTDLDPDTWLMRHMSILALLHRIANASISKIYSLRNWYMSTRCYKSWISPNFIPRYASYMYPGTRKKFHPSWRNPQLRKIQSYILHHVESYVMYIPLLNGRSLILR
jgi:hypothetical protein